MKKKSIKSLKLNKKSISNLQNSIRGGETVNTTTDPSHTDFVRCHTVGENTDYPPCVEDLGDRMFQLHSHYQEYNCDTFHDCPVIIT